MKKVFKIKHQRQFKRSDFVRNVLNRDFED